MTSVDLYAIILVVLIAALCTPFNVMIAIIISDKFSKRLEFRLGIATILALAVVESYLTVKLLEVLNVR